MFHPDDALPAFVVMSRVVIALMSLLLLMMPFSEQYRMLDNFPHGQDTELSLLAFLMILGLSLLFARSSNKAFSRLFAGLCLVAGVVLRFLLRHRKQALAAAPPTGCASPPGSAPANCTFPLLI